MIRRDYIMRMVEEFARFLTAIMKLRTEGNFESAMKKIDEAYTKMIDVDPSILKSVKPENLIDFLTNEKSFDNSYLKMIAELLYEEGMIYHENGDPINAYNVLGKAKILFNYLSEHEKTYSFDWYEKLAAIDEIIAQK